MLYLLIGIAAAAFVAPVGLVAFWYVRVHRRPRVLCLMYHRIASSEAYARCLGTEKIFTLPADEFERQVEYLVEENYTFLTPSQMRDYVLGRTSLPDKSVLMTFDDGCESVYSVAAPILAKHKARGTVFVTTDPTAYVFTLHGSTDRRMTDDELRLVDGPVICVGSHGVTHLPMRGMSDADLHRELAESKRELERILSRPVEYLGIPCNWYDRRVMRMAHAVGYQGVWISNPDVTRPGMSPFGLPRVNVEGHLALPEFIQAISPMGVLQRAIVSRIKRTPGQILGPKYWEPFRKQIMKCIPGGYITTKRILGATAVAGLLGIVAVVMLWVWVR